MSQKKITRCSGFAALPDITVNATAEYLFISLFRAFAESLASENASRLSSMPAVEKNVGEQLSEIKKQFHQMRQMVITEELLDIVAGFEALRNERI